MTEHLDAVRHVLAQQISELKVENARLREALQRIANGKVDGLDYIRDTAVLEKCIQIALAALKN